jgi:hypothetical protein
VKSLTLFFGLLVMIPSAHADILFGTTLPASVGDIFTVAASLQFLAQPVTFTTPFEVDQIKLDLGGFSASPFTVWVTDAVGASATISNVLFQQNFTSPNTNSSLNLQVVTFTPHLLLVPGSYFLVLSSSSTSSTDGWGANNSTLASNSNFGSLSLSQEAETTNNSFAPASTFTTNGLNTDLAFQFIEDTPEPATWLLCVSGVALMAVMKRRARSK